VTTLLPVITLLAVITLGLLITRIATVALMLTGMSRELARFQARSAFVGVGFTTSESERVMEHPVRRRIVMLLMLLGNAGFVAAVSSLIPVFLSATGGESMLPFLGRLVWLGGGLVLLGAIAMSKWIDRQLSRAISWALQRWTRLDVWDYPSLLHLSAGYMVSELKVEPGDWVAGKTLAEIRLGDEGVQVLGIRRVDGDYVGAPIGSTYIRKGDTLIIYGQMEQLAELSGRTAGMNGDVAHEERVEELQRTIEEQERTRRDAPGNGETNEDEAAPEPQQNG